MQLSTKNITVLIGMAFSFFTFGQTDTPCGAPALPVNTSCTYTSGTTVGATQQTNAANGGTPTCGSMGPDVWYSFVAPASGSVVISTQAGTITDGVMGLYAGPCTAPTQIACNDDAVGLMPQISNGSLTPGVTYYIRFWRYGGGTGTFGVCVTSSAPAPTNVSCNIPDPICSGSPITFTAQANGTQASTVNPGNNYDCLFTSPNPSWYYLQISNPGNLAIDITAGSDVDFELWGPFPNLANAIANCNLYGVPVDCSYSTSAIEQANANGVLAGQVYVLLVTNYANTVQTITVNDAPSNTATTDCSIVPLPVEFEGLSGAFVNNSVELSWSTLSEKNNDYFIVEHSSDGKVWSSFELVEGAGNSTNILNYSAVHRNPASGVNYYRVKQFDTDGTTSISDVISISKEHYNPIRLVPNPAQENVFVHSSEAFSAVNVLDLNGNLLIKKEFSAVKQASLDVRELSSGVYFVQVESANGTQIQRLVVN